jgi:electron transport complex protein RnfG
MTEVKAEQSICKVAINLIMACLISGCIIGLVYYITAPIAAEKNEIMKQESMKNLVKDAETFKPVADKENWFAAEKNGKVIAYVVPGHSKGYGGAITMLVAVTADGKVLDYTILTSNETPGLGDNAGKEPFKSQINGKKADALTVVKDPSNKDNVQAMTGATISSRAVTLAVKNAVQDVEQFTGGK